MNKIKECHDCKSKNILVTQTIDGKKIFSYVCLDCGYLYESKDFKKMMAKFDDPEFKVDISKF